MEEPLDFLKPRVLGIDYGESRIGLAITDELGMLAHPLETIHCRDCNPLDRIQALVSEKRVAEIVIGFPLSLNETEGPAAQKVRGFHRRLVERLPEMSVIFVDERYSTVEAQLKLRAVGKTTKGTRGVIDQAAAVEILQGYLDAGGIE